LALRCLCDHGPVPRSWTVAMAILIVCLLASIVIAAIKL
jgi:hypothetical protein